MGRPDPFRVLVLSVVKHDYIARGVASHPRCELAAVADDRDQVTAVLVEPVTIAVNG